MTQPDQPTPMQMTANQALAYALGRIDALQHQLSIILAQVVEKQSGREMNETELQQIAAQIMGTLREGDTQVRQQLGIEEPPS